VSFNAEASINGADTVIRTNFRDGSAVTEGNEGPIPLTRTQPISGKPVVLPNIMFGSYVALAKRLSTDPPGTEFRGYIPPLTEIGISIMAVHTEQTQVGTTVFPVRRYELMFIQPTGDLPVVITATLEGDLVRLSIPSQTLDVVRSDLALPTSRLQVFANPGDEAVLIPSIGFNLGATITRPRNATPTATLPAVILLGDSGVNDRDGFMFGVPTLGQLAGALADAGFFVVRYDKRGYGQSGGRSESATLADLGEDVRAVVKWLDNRKDIDQKRLAVAGHGEGAMVALIAAGRERKIAAVVSIAGPSTTGVEMLLEQQQYQFSLTNVPLADREAKVALQKQLQQAVLTGKGWDTIPPQLRREADTPWFQSVLAYEPSKVLGSVRQPLLIVHGEVDKQVPASHADRLAEIARVSGKSKAVEVVIVRGVNHLLVPAVTGDTTEYGTLSDRNVSKDVTMTITTWLARTLPAAAR
jgi:uncharacterized protein